MRYSDYKEAKKIFNGIIKDLYGEISKYDMIASRMGCERQRNTGYRLPTRKETSLPV